MNSFIIVQVSLVHVFFGVRLRLGSILRVYTAVLAKLHAGRHLHVHIPGMCTFMHMYMYTWFWTEWRTCTDIYKLYSTVLSHHSHYARGTGAAASERYRRVVGAGERRRRTDRRVPAGGQA